MRVLREAVPVGLWLLALTPLVSAMRSVVNEEWLAYLLYVLAGGGLLGAGWAWHKGSILAVRLAFAVSAIGLLVHFVLTLGVSVNPYLVTSGVRAIGATIGAIYVWRTARGGAIVVVATTGAAFLAYLVLNLRDGVSTPTVLVALVLGIVGALVAARGLTARAEGREPVGV